MGHAAPESDLIPEVLAARRVLLERGSLPEKIVRAFAGVGEALKVDRVYLFGLSVDDDLVLCASQLHEWCAPGVEPQADNPDLQDIPLHDAGYTRWVDSFQAYRPIHGPVDTFPDSERAILESQGIQSLLVLPVFAGGALFGFVGFDDCSFRRTWSNRERSALFILTITLGWVFTELSNHQADRAVSNAISFIDKMMNVQALALSAVPGDVYADRSAARLAAATEVHRLLAETALEGCIDADDLLQRLRPHFERVLRQAGSSSEGLRLQSPDVVLNVTEAVWITLIATEVASSCAAGGSLHGDQSLSIGLSQLEDSVEFVIRLDSNVPAGEEPSCGLDAMARMMVRSLTGELGGNHSAPDDAQTFVRVRYPRRCP